MFYLLCTILFRGVCKLPGDFHCLWVGVAHFSPIVGISRLGELSIPCGSFLFHHNLYLQLLCMIGEAFDEHSEDVCGAVVNIRSKGDKIGLWTANGLNSQSIMEIG